MRKGFTLIELLIALSFFSVVMVVVGSVFGTGILAWKRGEEEGAVYQEARLTLERMAFELRNALPYEGAPFEGKEETLSFVQVRSPRLSKKTLEWVRVTYAVQPEEGSAVLVRRVDPLLKGEAEEGTLLESFSRIRFFYPSFEGDEWVWKDEWDPVSSQKRPPPFIKMELSLNDEEHWEKIFFVPSGTKGTEAPASPEEGS